MLSDTKKKAKGNQAKGHQAKGHQAKGPKRGACVGLLQVRRPTPTRHGSMSPGASCCVTRCPTVRACCAHASAVAYDGALYVFGGVDAAGLPRDTAFRYDPLGDTWQSSDDPGRRWPRCPTRAPTPAPPSPGPASCTC